MVKYRVTVDRSACIGCGVAPTVCGKVFMLGTDNGKNRVVPKYEVDGNEDVSVGEIPEELLDCVKTAAESCPASAIKVERID
ncbi:MAG: ferredoxin [Desulfurococcales archaeon]|nr:ferredoxin [Desulfurococcales archaeon]